VEKEEQEIKKGEEVYIFPPCKESFLICCKNHYYIVPQYYID
jgi:hypothetical protein